MPAYDYRCVACDTVFEITRAFGAADKVACPRCGGDTKRVFTPVGVHFKGSGFHNTDYRPARRDESAPAPSGTCPTSGSDACASCPASE